MTRPILIVDNTRSVDPTLPDLYDGIAANDHDELPVGVAFAMWLGMAAGRCRGFAFGFLVGMLLVVLL